MAKKQPMQSKSGKGSKSPRLAAFLINSVMATIPVSTEKIDAKAANAIAFSKPTAGNESFVTDIDKKADNNATIANRQSARCPGMTPLISAEKAVLC